MTSITPDPAGVCVGEEITFTAHGSNLDEVQWSTDPEAEEPSGTGRKFTTRWDLSGTKTVTAACGGSSVELQVAVLRIQILGTQWPKNNKLLIQAGHVMYAEGRPHIPDPNYLWIPPDTGGAFDPREGEHNASGGRFKTAYLAPVLKTPKMKQDQEHVKVEYSVDNGPPCEEQRLLNITQPTLPAVYSGTNPLEGTIDIDTSLNPNDWIQLIDTEVDYSIVDQFGAKIADSSRGSSTSGPDGLTPVRLVIREDVPFTSEDIPELQPRWEKVQTSPEFHVSTDVEMHSRFTDNLRLRIQRGQLDSVRDQIQVGVVLVEVDTHDWYVGVAEADDVKNPFQPIQITRNVFRVEVIEILYRDGNILRFRAKVTYDIDLIS